MQYRPYQFVMASILLCNFVFVPAVILRHKQNNHTINKQAWILLQHVFRGSSKLLQEKLFCKRVINGETLFSYRSRHLTVRKEFWDASGGNGWWKDQEVPKMIKEGWEAGIKNKRKPIKNVMWCQYTPIRTARMKKKDNTKCWRRATRTLRCCWWKGKLVKSLWNTVCYSLRGLTKCLPCDPAIPLPHIYQQRCTRKLTRIHILEYP